MDPYRELSVDEVAEAPRDPGIVGEVIAQFADPNAFYRELVQNAIDAGSPSIEIRLDYDADAQLLRVAVRDRGEGMSRDTLENQLLVLFRSTKEGDRTKIGKFGIGFASVLAPNPEVVIVDTVRAGKRLTLHLHRDLTYELFDTGAATLTGTTVTLELAMVADAVDAFAGISERTLVRWCRHAAIPIELIVARGDAPPTTTRIDRPLAIDDALICVRGTSPDGKLVAVVAITSSPTPYVGFFNHGLTLHETPEDLVGRFAVKVQDSRLGHTLSRDNVRRDLHFERAIVFARALIADELPAAAAQALLSAAVEDDLARHGALVAAINAAGLALQPRQWTFPLVEWLGERRTVDLPALGKRAWASTKRSALTAALARDGVPVLHVSPWGTAPINVIGLVPVEVAAADHELTCVTPIELDARDLALVDQLAGAFAAAGRAPSAIVIAELDGRHAPALAIAGRGRDAAPGVAYIVDHDQAAFTPFGRLRRPPLVLAVAHPFVRAARLADDPRVAAAHLARAVLLHYRLLDLDHSTALLEHALDRLGVGVGVGGDA